MDLAWRIRVYDLAETRAADVAIYGPWSEEMRMVEGIEKFRPKLQGLCFRQSHLFLQGAVEVVRSGTRKESPPGVAQLSE